MKAKLIYYKVFKTKVYNRFVQFKSKRTEIEERVQKVAKSINKFNDIPLGYHMADLLERFNINKFGPNKGKYNLAKIIFTDIIYGIISNKSVSELSKKIPINFLN